MVRISILLATSNGLVKLVIIAPNKYINNGIIIKVNVNVTFFFIVIIFIYYFFSKLANFSALSLTRFILL